MWQWFYKVAYFVKVIKLVLFRKKHYFITHGQFIVLSYLAADESLAIAVIFPSLKTNPTLPLLSFCKVIVLSNGLGKVLKK